MWNPFAWFCSKRLPNPPPDVKDGEEARRARVDAEQHLRDAQRLDREVDQLLKSVPPARRDTFAEDLRKAFGT